MSGARRRNIAEWIGYKISRAQRHGSFQAWAKHVVSVNTRKRVRVDFFADGLGTRGRIFRFRTTRNLPRLGPNDID